MPVAGAILLRTYVEWLSPQYDAWSGPPRRAPYRGARHRGSDFGRGDGFEKARGDHCCRCRRLFAAHGSGRRRNARASQKPAPRSVRSELDKGRTLETTGDGMLIEFANAVQAARVAAR